MRLITDDMQTRFWSDRDEAIQAAKDLAGQDGKQIEEAKFQDADGWTWTVCQAEFSDRFYIQPHDEEGYMMTPWGETPARH